MSCPPKISVLIPVFNGEKYLAECLDSVLAQDFTDVEILIADDDSTDGSVAIIQTYAAREPRIRWWKNPRNCGLTGNSNVCLQAARGEYIKFVHQDDKLLSPAAIRKMSEALDATPAAAIAGCRQHLTGTGSRPRIFAEHAGYFAGRELVVTCLERNTNFLGQPTLVMFRRGQATRGFDERFTGFLDFEMWCHLLEQGGYVYLNEVLATWRVHPDHQTARSRAQLDREHLQFMEIYYAKPWLKAMATERMLFVQIYYLRKKYGVAAKSLTTRMLSQLSPPGYARWWLRHKGGRPFVKISERFRANRKNPAAKNPV